MVGVRYQDSDVTILNSFSDKLPRKNQISKGLSRSTPSLVSSSLSLASGSSTSSSQKSTISACQKKLRHYFSEVPAEERVLNYYGCALASDILLHGTLYITPNFFGFCSNIFGHVTKILIPTASVVSISKTKIAKIIPNAIAIATENERYVFCTFLSRDSTFKLMKQVLDDAKESTPAADIPPSVEGQFLQDELSVTENETDDNSKPSMACTDTDGFSAGIPSPDVCATTTMESAMAVAPKVILGKKLTAFASILRNWIRSRVVIAILIVLLAALYVSAGLMMIRIDRLHAAYLDHQLLLSEHYTKNNLLRYLKSDVEQILKVRTRLETLTKQFESRTEYTDAGPISVGAIDLKKASS